MDQQNSVPLLRQKFQDGPMGVVGLVGCQDVARVGDHDELCIRNSICDQLGIGRRHELVALAVDHKRGRCDLFQPAVGFPHHDSLQLSQVTGGIR